MPTLTRVTSTELVEATGLTHRQVDHWSSHGYLCCYNAGCGSGYQRFHPADEIEIARIMRVLTEDGLAPGAAHHAAHNDGRLSSRVQVLVSLDELTAATP